MSPSTESRRELRTRGGKLRHRCRRYVLVTALTCALASATTFFWEHFVGAGTGGGSRETYPLVREGPGEANVSVSVAVLVALQDDPLREAALREWDFFASLLPRTIPRSAPSMFYWRTGGEPDRVTVLCSDYECKRSVLTTRYLEPLLVDPLDSWLTIFEAFLRDNPDAHAVGLYGEGALPSRQLLEHWGLLRILLSETDAATGFVARSRGRVPELERRGRARGQFMFRNSEAEHEAEWLRDDFMSQLWGNRGIFSSERLGEAGMDARPRGDSMLIEIIREIIVHGRLQGASHDGEERSQELLLVDGTAVLGAYFAVPAHAREEDGLTSTVRADGVEDTVGETPADGLEEVQENRIYIGSLGHVLVVSRARMNGEVEPERTGGIKSGGRGGAPSRLAMEERRWPPSYILENVALPNGLVIVTSVNCGYLDMAANFIASVRRTSTAKVLFVAMDNVSFDFMDALAPGCVVRLGGKEWEGRHAVRAGEWGDTIFMEETTVRPDILVPILDQGYPALWTDVDIVWLSDPLPLLPDPRKGRSPDVVLQQDNRAVNKCTCFMFLKPTPLARTLLVRWKEEMSSSKVMQNQLSFQRPLIDTMGQGLRVWVLPEEVMPPGLHYFNKTYMELNQERYEGKVVMVHNNWVIGHEVKYQRFVEYGLWLVGNTTFPKCGGEESNPSLRRRLEYLEQRADRGGSCAAFSNEGVGHDEEDESW